MLYSRVSGRFLLVTVAALAASLLALAWTSGVQRIVVTTVLATLWVVLVAAGIRRNTPSRVESWRYLVGAGGAFGTGLALREVPGSYVGSVVPELAISLGYVLVVVGLVKWSSQDGSPPNTIAVLDTVLVTLGMLFVSWVLLVAPALERTDDLASLAFNGLYPAIDAGLLTMAYFGLLSRRRSNPALAMLVIGLAAILVGDLIIAVATVRGAVVPTGAVEAAYVTAFVAVAAAAQHPSMSRVGGPGTGATRESSRHRMTVLVVLVAICAALPLVGDSVGSVDIVVRSGFLSVILVGMFVRGELALSRARRSETKARHDATHDALTGLPDRSALPGVFRRLRSHTNTPVTVLFADFDNFKAVNDSYGDRAGDELIRQAARRIRATVAPPGTVVRYAGDEFMVITRSTRSAAERLAKRVSASFAEPFELGVASVYLTVSVGIASSDGPVVADDLIREADSAMYFAKSQGAGTHAFFDESLRTAATSALELGSALRGAMRRGDLSVHYQPIVAVDDHTPVVFEALLRWTHDGVPIAPDVFIPVAESTNLISEIGTRVLDTALADLVRLRADGRPDARMSVNLSVLQLRDERFPDVVADLLARHGLQGDSLGLEVTESALIADPAVTQRVLLRLADQGVQLVLDDFGIGHSSLGRLRDLPISVLKIDKSFIGAITTDATAVSLVTAIAAMANALEVHVVAEGVETPGQAAIVERLGIGFAQGYLFGRPAPIEDHLGVSEAAHGDAVVPESSSPSARSTRNRRAAASTPPRSRSEAQETR